MSDEQKVYTDVKWRADFFGFGQKGWGTCPDKGCNERIRVPGGGAMTNCNCQRVTIFWYDYAENIGNTGSDEDFAQSLGNDIHDQTTAWGLGVNFGQVKKKGDWSLSYGYYQIGANAVVAAFNDSDFGGPAGIGATNRKGHKLGFSFRLSDNIDVNWTGYIVRPLDPSTVTAGSSNESVFRSQADIVFKF